MRQLDQEVGVNLMCPARLVLLPADAPPVDPALRVVHVYAPPGLAEPASRLASPLGVRLTLIPELGTDPAEDLRSIADQHRGETVVVLGVEVDLEPPVMIDHTGDSWTVFVEHTDDPAAPPEPETTTSAGPGPAGAEAPRSGGSEAAGPTGTGPGGSAGSAAAGSGGAEAAGAGLTGAGSGGAGSGGSAESAGREAAGSGGAEAAGAGAGGVGAGGVEGAGAGGAEAAGSANEVTVQAYEQAADRFRASLRAGANQELIDLVEAHLPAGAQVLEIGSGTGRDALELERRGFRVRRTDAAGSFIAMMRMDGKEADPLNVLTDDLGGPYDLVFADAVFLHFDPDELAGVLTKAHRAAPLLAFSTREGEGAEWSTRHLDLPRHFTLWQEGPLRELLSRTGWSVTELRRTRGPIGAWFQILAARIQVSPPHDSV